MVYGRPPPIVLRFLVRETQVESVASVLIDCNEALCQLKYHLNRVLQTMKKHLDAHHQQVTYIVVDWVYVKLRPHRQHSVARRINPKFYPQYLGPFLVISQIGEVAYKVKLPNSAQIHLVFHVS